MEHKENRVLAHSVIMSDNADNVKSPWFRLAVNVSSQVKSSESPFRLLYGCAHFSAAVVVVVVILSVFLQGKRNKRCATTSLFLPRR